MESQALVRMPSPCSLLLCLVCGNAPLLLFLYQPKTALASTDATVIWFLGFCEDLPLPLAHVGDKKVKRFHFSEIIGRLPYMRATVTVFPLVRDRHDFA
jgi:hypothetical protein